MYELSNVNPLFPVTRTATVETFPSPKCWRGGGGGDWLPVSPLRRLLRMERRQWDNRKSDDVCDGGPTSCSISIAHVLVRAGRPVGPLAELIARAAVIGTHEYKCSRRSICHMFSRYTRRRLSRAVYMQNELSGLAVNFLPVCNRVFDVYHHCHQRETACRR